MAGMRSMASWLAGGAAAFLLLAPAAARACERHQAKAELQVPAEAKAEAGEKQAAPKPGVKGKSEKAKSKSEPEKKSAISKPGEVLAATCSCDGPGSCTCKKGQCSCKKCNGAGMHRMFDSLSAQPAPREVQTRRDASAGAFI